MPKKNKGSGKSSDLEYCRGYVDEHGQWNNGFYCPQWGGPGRKYCCGTETHKFCCPKEELAVKKASLLEKHLPLICGLVAACVVLLIILVVVICYFCRGCLIYRRRKRLQNGSTICSNQVPMGGRVPGYTVSYSVCPHPPYLPEGIGHSVCYPMDDPPPYPGDSQNSMDEKQPLNPSHLYVSMENQEETLPPNPDCGNTESRGTNCYYHGLPSSQCTNCGPAISRSNSSTATAIVADTPEQHNLEDINVSGDFADLNSAGSTCVGEPHHHEILSDFRNVTIDDKQLQGNLVPKESTSAAATASCSSNGDNNSSPMKTIEIGAYLRTLHTQHQGSEENSDVADMLPTTKLLSEQEGDQTGTSGPTTYPSQPDLPSSLSSYPSESLMSTDDSVIQIIPQG